MNTLPEDTKAKLYSLGNVIHMACETKESTVEVESKASSRARLWKITRVQFCDGDNSVRTNNLE